MTTQISVYREASRILGDYRIATLSDDSPTRYAFDDAWDRVVEYVLRAAYWKFALRTTTMDESAVEPVPGFDYVYDLPCDWLRTHALFFTDGGRELPFDARHQIIQIHTRRELPYIRYISSDYADPEVWPEHFAQAVACRLAFDTAERVTGNPAKQEQAMGLFQEQMSRALTVDAIPEWPWLRFELDGSLYRGTRFMLDNGFWRFAVRTVIPDRDDDAEVSPGYDYAFEKPEDWGRTFHLYENYGNSWRDVSYRDEDGYWHTSAQTIVVRYVSTDGEDAGLWSDSFERACLAYLELEEAKRDPAATNIMQAKMLAYAESMKNARIKNDMVERPRIHDSGKLVAARLGASYTSRAREQGLGW
jgi:hypothetical protein